jgi:hypothetical protein
MVRNKTSQFESHVAGLLSVYQSLLEGHATEINEFVVDRKTDV